MDWHKTTTDDVLKQLNTSIERGLTQSEVDQRLQKVWLERVGRSGHEEPVEDSVRAVQVGDGADLDRGGRHFIARRRSQGCGGDSGDCGLIRRA